MYCRSSRSSTKPSCVDIRRCAPLTRRLSGLRSPGRSGSKAFEIETFLVFSRYLRVEASFV